MLDVERRRFRASPHRNVAEGPRVLLTLALVLLIGVPSCPGDCCNDCSRGYYVGDPGVYVSNVAEHGNECEFDDIAPVLDAGARYTLLVEVRSRSDGTDRYYSVDVIEHARGDATATLCKGIRAETAAELLDRAATPGTTVCLLDEIQDEIGCTEKACGIYCDAHRLGTRAPGSRTRR